MRKGLYKAKRRFVMLSVFFIGILSLFVGTIFQDWMTIMSNKQDMKSLSNYYTQLLEEEESLTSEVTKLHDNDYVARYAREKYMYSLPGEIIIKIPEEEN